MSVERAKRVNTRRKLLFIGIICLGGLAMLEGGVRVMNRVRLGRWTVSDPEESAANTRFYVGHVWLGQIPRPSARVYSKGRHINTNSFGYRGPEFELVKPPGVLRIACIGGSTTFDVKVSDDTKTWPAQLQNLLRDAHGRQRVEVINAATNGYALPRTIIDLALRTLDMQPDWVICYPGVNDLAYAHQPSHQWGQSHRALVHPPPPARWWDGLLPYSELYNEIQARIRYARQKRYGNWRGVEIERRDRPDARGITAFERNLATLAGICRGHDIRLVLVTVRTAYDPQQPPELQHRLAKGDLMDHPHLSLAGHYVGYETINRLIRQAAERFDLSLIDQAKALPGGEAQFEDSVHFNDAGSAAFAAFAAERLAPELSRRLASDH